MGILLYIINNILSQAAFVIGIVVVVGMLAQKKSGEKIIASAFKAMIGFTLINTAGQSLGMALLPLQTMYTKIFGLTMDKVDINSAIPEGLAGIGMEMAIIFALGFLMNIVIARLTKFKYVHLSPHVSFFYAGLIAALLKYGTGFNTIMIIVVGSIILGIYLTASCAYVAPWMKTVKGGEGFTLGHSSSVGILISSWLARARGNKDKDLEATNFPKRLNFLREMTIALSIVMTLLFMVSCLLAGPAWISENVSGGRDFVTYSLQNGIVFGMWITVIITGVRMMVGEIIPAFHGFADKIIPNAMPGLDIPLLFPNYPVSVIVGFLSSLVAGFLGMWILAALKYPIIVFPALIPTFFTGAITAIFGNANGGRRGAVIGSFVNGLILIFGQAFLLPMVGSYQAIMRILAETDYAFSVPLLGYLLKLAGL